MHDGTQLCIGGKGNPQQRLAIHLYNYVHTDIVAHQHYAATARPEMCNDPSI